MMVYKLIYTIVLTFYIFGCTKSVNTIDIDLSPSCNFSIHGYLFDSFTAEGVFYFKSSKTDYIKLPECVSTKPSFYLFAIENNKVLLAFIGGRRFLFDFKSNIMYQIYEYDGLSYIGEYIVETRPSGSKVFIDQYKNTRIEVKIGGKIAEEYTFPIKNWQEVLLGRFYFENSNLMLEKNEDFQKNIRIKLRRIKKELSSGSVESK